MFRNSCWHWKVYPKLRAAVGTYVCFAICREPRFPVGCFPSSLNCFVMAFHCFHQYLAITHELNIAMQKQGRSLHTPSSVFFLHSLWSSCQFFNVSSVIGETSFFTLQAGLSSHAIKSNKVIIGVFGAVLPALHSIFGKLQKPFPMHAWYSYYRL